MLSNMKRHKSVVHDVDVIYYPCNAEGEGCSYEAKTASVLKRHKTLH